MKLVKVCENIVVNADNLTHAKFEGGESGDMLARAFSAGMGPRPNVTLLGEWATRMWAYLNGNAFHLPGAGD